MINKIFNFIAITIFSFVVISCHKSQRFETSIAVSDSVHIKRVDLDLINIDTAKIETDIDSFIKKYPVFAPFYFSDILELSKSDKGFLTEQMKTFLQDTLFSKVNADVFSQYSDVTDIEAELSESYALLKNFFPKIVLPEIYFFVSGFNRSVVITPNFIAIGADMYLGSDYPRYADISYKYLTYNMRRESITVDIISAILFSHYPSDVKNDRLLENMLYRGKLLYVLSTVLPHRKPHDIIGYTKFQWEWSRKYESEIWNTILDQNDLYSSDLILIRKYLNDAPFTTPVSQESPGRLGAWVGWQIVNSWMKKNNSASLTDLLKENNYQKMLDESGYKP